MLDEGWEPKQPQRQRRSQQKPSSGGAVTFPDLSEENLTRASCQSSLDTRQRPSSFSPFGDPYPSVVGVIIIIALRPVLTRPGTLLPAVVTR
ncbi:hypothetical protein IFM46972_04525 [Aspergillus udagawae]|uniref:Uncharacterized protein n=1 Tax=Aspergillus udagawae TaxID=91492 RepID=A0A8H3NLP1_9EURO|nr:hypothetical protein IFM46972_04525 [Aspergillus udagawae]